MSLLRCRGGFAGGRVGPPLLVFVLASALLSCSRSAPSALVRSSDGVTANCRHAASATDWAKIRAESIQFGLDDFALTSRRARVVVEDVRLINPTGDLRLANVAFQSIGGVGNAGDWGFDDVPPGAIRVPLPAVLTYRPPGTGWPESAGLIWQVAVGLRLAHGAGGTADGVRVSYDVDGRSHEVVGLDHVGLFYSERQCQAEMLRDG